MSRATHILKDIAAGSEYKNLVKSITIPGYNIIC
jgi:hypothetical protein